MGRIVVTEFVSLDGVMEAPGGGEGYKHAGWTFKIDRGKEGDKFKLNETLNSEALLLGRVTYEGFAAAWPSRTNEFADKFNSMPKYVVSSTRLMIFPVVLGSANAYSAIGPTRSACGSRTQKRSATGLRFSSSSGRVKSLTGRPVRATTGAPSGRIVAASGSPSRSVRRRVTRSGP